MSALAEAHLNQVESMNASALKTIKGQIPFDQHRLLEALSLTCGYDNAEQFVAEAVREHIKRKLGDTQKLGPRKRKP